MDVTLKLATLPLWLATIVVVIAPTVIAMAGCMWVRRLVALEKLTANNEVAGFKFAVVGVLYAVLLGFVVVVVWEKFRDAETAVIQEAGDAASLYRLADAFGGGQGKAVRSALDGYLQEAIAEDWPAMAKGGFSPRAGVAINTLYAVVLAPAADDRRTLMLTTAMAGELDSLTKARRARLVLARGVVPGVIWAALLVGAAATIGFTFFFGTHNVRAQVLMTGLLASLVFVIMLVVLSVNHPFTGDVSVSTEPLQAVLDAFRSG